MNPPPPIPEDSAWTTPLQSMAVMAASTAEPLRRIFADILVHTEASEDTAPERERGKGREREGEGGRERERWGGEGDHF